MEFIGNNWLLWLIFFIVFLLGLIVIQVKKMQNFHRDAFDHMEKAMDGKTSFFGGFFAQFIPQIVCGLLMLANGVLLLISIVYNLIHS